MRQRRSDGNHSTTKVQTDSGRLRVNARHRGALSESPRASQGQFGDNDEMLEDQPIVERS
jgi:hypothetical protein